MANILPASDRVRRPAATALREPGGGATELDVMPPEPGSHLGAAGVRLAPAGSRGVDAADRDCLLYVLDGSGTVTHAIGTRYRLERGSAVLLTEGEQATVVAGDAGLQLVEVSAAAGCDRHAPLGERRRHAQLELARRDAATSGREFQVLFDMTNGSSRATMFVGLVPTGRSPWHFHQYDEIVWILDGAGRFHLAGRSEPFTSGAAFRVHSREPHVVENSGEREMLLLGVFTPAGSPAAAFLCEDPNRRSQAAR
ncbi:MAG: cupin domain-containing protein [Candidatus Dormiibacterota bacterium]